MMEKFNINYYVDKIFIDEYEHSLFNDKLIQKDSLKMMITYYLDNILSPFIEKIVDI